jgi:hypothetical protein
MLNFKITQHVSAQFGHLRVLILVFKARQQQRTGTHKKQKGRTSMTKINQKKEQQSP